MKKSKLRNIIREIIKEQTSPNYTFYPAQGGYNPVGNAARYSAAICDSPNNHPQTGVPTPMSTPSGYLMIDGQLPQVGDTFYDVCNWPLGNSAGQYPITGPCTWKIVGVGPTYNPPTSPSWPCLTAWNDPTMAGCPSMINPFNRQSSNACDPTPPPTPPTDPCSGFSHRPQIVINTCCEWCMENQMAQPQGAGTPPQGCFDWMCDCPQCYKGMPKPR